MSFVNFFIGTSLIGIPVAMLAWWLAHKGLPALDEDDGDDPVKE